MVKLIGISIIVLCGTLKGLMISERYCKRVKYLKLYIELLMHIKNEIKYSKNTIYEILTHYSCDELLIKHIKKFLKESKNNDFHESWQVAFNSTSSEIGISKEEENSIIRFANEFGNSDFESQIEYLNYNLNIMQNHLNEAIEVKKTKGKLPIILGIGISLCITLLLI